jgi:starch phosphorylase
MQRTLGHLRRDSGDWWRRSILNTARMAWFSSDRTIGEYARDIWRTGGAIKQ